MLDPLCFINQQELQLKEMYLSLEIYRGGLTSGEGGLLCLYWKCCTVGVTQSRCEGSDPNWVRVMTVSTNLLQMS